MPTPKNAVAPEHAPAAEDDADLAKHDGLSREVLRQFRVVFSSVRGHFREVEKSTGLGGAQVWALSHIRDNPSESVTQLAAALDVHQSTASNLVRSLVAKDLVKAERSKTDRRSVRLLIRPSGRALLRRVPGHASGVLPRALNVLDAATLKRLKRDLTALVQTMAPDQAGAQTPLSEI